MSISGPFASATARRLNRIHYAMGLARFVESRRHELELTVTGAAEIAGMEPEQWRALEAGWVPAEEAKIDSIAATLCVHRAQIALLAFIGRHSQLQAC